MDLSSLFSNAKSCIFGCLKIRRTPPTVSNQSEAEVPNPANAPELPMDLQQVPNQERPGTPRTQEAVINEAVVPNPDDAPPMDLQAPNPGYDSSPRQEAVVNEVITFERFGFQMAPPEMPLPNQVPIRQ